jgi:5-methylcytosine-specific restriction enzyme A
MPQAPAQHRRPGQAAYVVRERMRKQSIDVDRGSAAQRGYGHKWRQYRIGYLRSHPLCRSCESKGRLTSATIVDHIKDHRGDVRLFWDPNNHQPMCKRCHDAKTASTVLNASL